MATDVLGAGQRVWSRGALKAPTHRERIQGVRKLTSARIRRPAVRERIPNRLGGVRAEVCFLAP